jgi:hypothetical protein
MTTWSLSDGVEACSWRSSAFDSSHEKRSPQNGASVPLETQEVRCCPISWHCTANPTLCDRGKCRPPLSSNTKCMAVPAGASGLAFPLT